MPSLKAKKLKIYITARDSFIAKNILEQLDYDFYTTNRSELDLTSSNAVNDYFADKYFDFVIHTACAGGRRNQKDTKEIFDINFDMFENLLNNQDHFKYLINIGSGADKQNTWYGKAKKVIGRIIKEKPNMFNLRCYGVWGKYELPDRFPITCINSTEITIEEDKLFRYIYVNELVKIIDEIIGVWPKKREMTVGEPILLSDFARLLNPNLKIIIRGKGEDYI